MSSRSSSGSFEVAWRSTASARSLAGHAGAVVADADQPAAAAVGDDLDARRAGVERVLDEFLDHARRTLHHLARRDAVDDGFGELAYGHVAFLTQIERRRWARAYTVEAPSRRQPEGAVSVACY